MRDGLQQLKRDLETLARLRQVTVPEVVRGIKASMLSDGAQPEIVAGFFDDLDEIAALHIN